MVACALSPLGALLTFRTIINGSFLVMGILMGIIATFASLQMNTLLVLFMMLFLGIFQFTLGTYSWVYVGQVTCQEGLSLATSLLWASVFILSLVTGPMFENLQTTGTFAFFGTVCILCSIFFFFFLRETRGLSPEQAASVYA